MSCRDFPLLLTATIDPRGMESASRPDPKLREADYIAALERYAECGAFKTIVFAENSGWDLAGLRQAAERFRGLVNVELLSLDQNDFPRSRGKSYGELMLVQSAVDGSELIQAAGGFIKITGRIAILNIRKLVSHLPTTADLVIDLRDHPIFDLLRTGWSGHHADTRFFACSVRLFDAHLRNRYDELDESRGLMIENLLYDVTKATYRGGRFEVVPRLPVEPAYTGLAGHWSKNYGSRTERAKRLVRAGTRKLLPWLWI